LIRVSELTNQLAETSIVLRFGSSADYKRSSARELRLLTQTYDQFSVIATMSVNDKVKIIWKTSCQWQDRAHWPKRKDIKLRDGDTETSTPLKAGDARVSSVSQY